MKKTALIALSTLLALTLAACGSKESEKTTESLSGAAVETVSLAPADDVIEALGTVRSTTIANLSAKTVGNVTQVLVAEGDRVKEGQLLLTIDDRDAAAQQRKAAAGLDEVENAIAGADAARQAAASQSQLATATYNRYVTLKERGSVSPQEFEEVEARYRGATAQKQQAENMYAAMVAKRAQVRADADSAAAFVSWTRITSPVDGVVTAKNVDVGTQAMPGMLLMTVESTSGYRLDTTIDESRIGAIKSGSTATIRVDSTGAELQGTVIHVSPALDPGSRSYIVKLSLPASDGLASGMSARARFRIGTTKAITIPSSAIVNQGQLTGVWSVDGDGIARMRFIQPGRTLGARIEVLSGINDGDRIVTTPLIGIRDGVKVAEAATQKGSK